MKRPACSLLSPCQRRIELGLHRSSSMEPWHQKPALHHRTKYTDVKTDASQSNHLLASSTTPLSTLKASVFITFSNKIISIKAINSGCCLLVKLEAHRPKPQKLHRRIHTHQKASRRRRMPMFEHRYIHPGEAWIARYGSLFKYFNVHPI